MIIFLTPTNITEYLDYFKTTTIWIPILSDQDRHYIENRISFIYIYSPSLDIEFVVNVNHRDADKIDMTWFIENLPTGDRICYKNKYLNDITCRDADMIVWYNTNHPIKLPKIDNDVFSIYKSRLHGMRDVNDVIPIMRIIEHCRRIRKAFMVDYNHSTSRGYIFYNDVLLNALTRLEQSGVAIDHHEVKTRFGKTIDGRYMYTDYMPYTLTGRPSNSHGGINFNALNKSDGTRQIIISRYTDGRLIEYDYDSYHLRLLGDLIGFEFPTMNLHVYMGEQYFKTRDVTPELYEKSKKITFKAMYGEAPLKYSDIEFFKQLEKFKDLMWKFYTEYGYYETPISKRKFKAEWFERMTRSKLFSYIIQSYETEMNAMVIDKILHYLYTKNSKLIMYTYDAFLIDYSPTDGRIILSEIRELITSFGYPVNIKAGVDYDDMVDITID